MDEPTYSVGNSTITLRFGSITTSRAEVIVSSDDGDLSRGGGVSAAILEAAGGPPVQGIRKHIPANLGNVVVTEAHQLPARYILHGITLPSYRRQGRKFELPTGTIVREVVHHALDALPILSCYSIAFPVIGTGVAGVSFDDAAREMSEALVHRLIDTEQHLRVELYLFDRYRQRSAEELADLFETRIRENLGVETAARDSATTLALPTSGSRSEQGQAPNVEGRRKAISEMLLHLGRQRDHLESDLLAALESPSVASSAQIRGILERLEEIARVRRFYQDELNPPYKDKVKVKPGTVFVSSTYEDLKLHRRLVRDVIERLGFQYVGMGEFDPASAPPGEYIREKVEQSEIYLGILGMRYGSIDPASGFSMTELEYRQAVASSKPRIMFVMDKSASLTVEMIETDVDGFAKLAGFRRNVLKSHVCGMFSSPESLAALAESALLAHKRRTSESQNSP